MGRVLRACVIVFWAVGAAAAAGPPFQITTTHLPLPHAGRPYRARVEVIGGVPPYRWRLLDPAALPPGFHFDAATGVLTGAPKSDQTFAVEIEAEDSSQPRLHDARLLPASTAAPLSLSWSAKPAAVAAGKLAGALRVRNQTGATVTLTVIVTAVNSEGKAFALRYAQTELRPQAHTPALAFAVEMPPGEYTIHADAVATEPQSGAIYRARQQLAPLTVAAGY